MIQLPTMLFVLTIPLWIMKIFKYQCKENIQHRDWYQLNAYFTNRVIITGIQPGTSPRHVKNWLKRIKHSHLLKINDHPITSPEQASTILSNAIQQNKYFKIRVSQDQQISIHEDNGLSMLYFDQLSTIAQHLKDIDTDKNSSHSTSDINKLEKSNNETNCYILKMIDAI